MGYLYITFCNLTEDEYMKDFFTFTYALVVGTAIAFLTAVSSTRAKAINQSLLTTTEFGACPELTLWGEKKPEKQGWEILSNGWSIRTSAARSTWTETSQYNSPLNQSQGQSMHTPILPVKGVKECIIPNCFLNEAQPVSIKFSISATCSWMLLCYCLPFQYSNVSKCIVVFVGAFLQIMVNLYGPCGKDWKHLLTQGPHTCLLLVTCGPVLTWDHTCQCQAPYCNGLEDGIKISFQAEDHTADCLAEKLFPAPKDLILDEKSLTCITTASSPFSALQLFNVPWMRIFSMMFSEWNSFTVSFSCRFTWHLISHLLNWIVI